jgi:hypothetical protein
MVDVTSIQQTSPNPASTVKGPNQTLGQDQFLALLIAQLKNQDPLNPVDSAEFIAQLAQFSQLEQAKQMTTALNTFIQRQDIANNNGLVSLIGHPVSALGSSFSLIPDSPVPLSYILAGDAANVTIHPAVGREGHHREYAAFGSVFVYRLRDRPQWRRGDLHHVGQRGGDGPEIRQWKPDGCAGHGPGDSAKPDSGGEMTGVSHQ